MTGSISSFFNEPESIFVILRSGAVPDDLPVGGNIGGQGAGFVDEAYMACRVVDIVMSDMYQAKVIVKHRTCGFTQIFATDAVICCRDMVRGSNERVVVAFGIINPRQPEGGKHHPESGNTKGSG